MNLFELAAKITLDSEEFDKGVADATKSGKKLSTNVGKWGAAFKAFSKVAVASAGAVAVGIGSLTTAAVKAYADFEQLTGGVETLFKNSADEVKAYAAEAYKTAGLSANEYMEQATSFSASLIQSLGGDTKEAARMADMAITDMSDNVNKMGGSIEMIQNAYQGFAKGNYTMLDNLRLGYGGTAREMARLVNESGVLSESEKINIDDSKHLGEALQDIGFAKIIEAINKTQEKMGIMGTTAKEAAETISGSFGMVKSSIKNLFTGLADENADFPALMEQATASVGVFADNLLPRVEQAMNGIVKLIEQGLPVIAEKLPTAMYQLLPTLFKSVIIVVKSLLDSLGDGIKGLPDFVNVALIVATELINAITYALPNLVPALVEGVMGIAQVIADNLEPVLDAGMKLLDALATGFVNALPILTDKLPELINTLVTFITDNAPALLEMGVDILLKIQQGIAMAIPDLVKALPQHFKNVFDSSKDLWKDLASVGVEIAKNMWEGFKNNWKALFDGFFGGGGSTLQLGEYGGKSRDFGFNARSDGSTIPAGYVTEEKMAQRREASAKHHREVMITQNIQAVAQTPAEFAAATRSFFEEAVWET